MSIALDKNISFQAKGVYACISEISAMGEFASTELISSKSPDSKYTVRKALTELKEAGYVEKVHEQTASSRGMHRVGYKCK